MSQKVKSIGATQVRVAMWICGGFVVAAVAVGVLAGALNWKPVIANGTFALAIVAAFALIETLNARYVTRHAMTCTKQAEGHTDKKIKEVREHTDRRVGELQEHTDKCLEELRRAIKFAGIFEVDQHLEDRAKRWEDN